MSDERPTKRSGLLNIRAVTSKIFSPDELANEINNMSETPRNTLKSVSGPAPYIPAYGGVAQPTFSQMNGIFHGVLRDGQKEVLLATAFNGTTRVLLEFNGWSRSWTENYAWQPNDGPSEYPEFPTQFEQCSNGIVVISQHDARPRFYDEDGHFAPLGYDKVPGSPTIGGPVNNRQYDFDAANQYSNTPNSDGFAHDANIFSQWTFQPGAKQTQMHTAFVRGRVGTTFSDGTVEGERHTDKINQSYAELALRNGISPGILRQGAYTGTVQWVDKYGNLSAMSARSNLVGWSQQSAAGPENIPFAGAGSDVQYQKDQLSQPPENLLKQLMWQDISICEEQSSEGKTIGRNLYRTRDNLNQESFNKLFFLPSNSQGGAFGFSTIPDNEADTYVDNGPDSWLVAESPDVVPMQRFRLCKQAFGRMFFANDPSDPGLVRYSMKGRWGTILRENLFYPDPSGGMITGLATVREGLLVFTDSSTFLIQDTSQETGFAVTTLSRKYGCVAPSSIASLPNGATIWLGKNAFYAYKDGAVQYFSETIRSKLKYINTSREKQAVAAVDFKSGEYRCWVAMNTSKLNNRCFVFDSRAPNTGWRTRTDISASSVCVTKDHRSYMLATGSVGTEPLATPFSAYILDTEVASTVFALPARTYTIETNWLLNESEYDAKTPITVYIWMLETSSQNLNVKVYRDWRKTLIHEETVTLYYEKDVPPFYGSTQLDSGETIRTSRPYWCKAKVFVPGCEVFKIILEASDRIEFVGLSYDYVPHPAGGARVQQ